MIKPIRQQLCSKCLEKYRKFENARRQKRRIEIREINPQVSEKVKIKAETLLTKNK